MVFVTVDEINKNPLLFGILPHVFPHLHAQRSGVQKRKTIFCTPDKMYVDLDEWQQLRIKITPYINLNLRVGLLLLAVQRNHPSNEISDD